MASSSGPIPIRKGVRLVLLAIASASFGEEDAAGKWQEDAPGDGDGDGWERLAACGANRGGEREGVAVNSAVECAVYCY